MKEEAAGLPRSRLRNAPMLIAPIASQYHSEKILTKKGAEYKIGELEPSAKL